MWCEHCRDHFDDDHYEDDEHKTGREFGPVGTAKAEHDEMVELIRDLRGWAETYEDHMGGEDFKRRAEVLKRADDLLLAKTGHI